MSENSMVLLAKTVSGLTMMDCGIRSRFQGAQRFYLLDFLGENLQKSCTRRAVDPLMIARERQADGVDDCYATVLPHRLKLDRVHAENRYLRRIEDWREGFDTQASQDRKSVV